MPRELGEGAAIPRAASHSAPSIPFVIHVEARATGTDISADAAAKAPLANAFPGRMIERALQELSRFYKQGISPHSLFHSQPLRLSFFPVFVRSRRPLGRRAPNQRFPFLRQSPKQPCFSKTDELKIAPLHPGWRATDGRAEALRLGLVAGERDNCGKPSSLSVERILFLAEKDIIEPHNPDGIAWPQAEENLFGPLRRSLLQVHLVTLESVGEEWLCARKEKLL